ncbi:MAG TPA: autotransporter assembly complex family protein [Marinospirillum sp.]|uniref:autotransporter assembly complex protein TamA n=1 Tax=Marinospirillum sp. TaxID=2183934 RepID=UPI002B476624|nr:autotransporter assembly complex family protein [Marinospirillum sp.]HKM14944.1 autotransporter assembly complex family protein [Marinospirillum sp.]
MRCVFLPINQLMKSYLLLFFLLLTFFYSIQTLAAEKKPAALVLQLKPNVAAVRKNIDAYLGEIEPRNASEMRRYARYARGQIIQAVEALGYYRYQINLEVLDGNPAQLVVNLALGEPVHLKTVSLKLSGPAQEQLSFTLPVDEKLATGQVLSHSAYDGAKQHFSEQAINYGYFAAEFTQNTLTIDPKAGTADIVLHFESGPRYRFGEVNFDQQGELTDALLRKFVRFKQGDWFDADQLSELSRELRASGYFNEVLVDIREQQADTQLHVPVEVLLRMRKPHSLDLGLGYSTDIGPRISASWTQYWLNNQGHSRGVDSELSLPRKAVSAWYQLPLTPPMTDKLRFTTAIEDEHFDDQASQRFSLGVQWHHRQASGWDRVLSLKGRQEKFQVGEDEDSTWLTLPGISYGRLKTNQRIDPSQGYRLQLEVNAGRKELLADINLLQVTAFARGLYTVFDSHRLLARMQLGFLSTEDFSRTPVSMRFFAGGDQSVRGYPYQELAPKSESGRPLGGHYLLASSVEYQYSLTPTWRLATFVDAGDATSKRYELKAPKIGLGIGVRWISPVGALRLDIAKGLDELQGGWQLHFSMGPEL